MLIWAPLFSLRGMCEPCFLVSGCSSHGRDRSSDFLSGGSLLPLPSMCISHALHYPGACCPNLHPDQNSIFTSKSVQLTSFCSHPLSLWIPFSSFFSGSSLLFHIFGSISIALVQHFSKKGFCICIRIIYATVSKHRL